MFGRFGFASTVDLRSGRNMPGEVQTMAEGKGDAPAGCTSDSPELEGLIPLGGRSVWEPVHVLGWNPGHESEECEYEVTEA